MQKNPRQKHTFTPFDLNYDSFAQFIRKDQLLNLSDAITLKEKNDKRIKELERELARKKVDDADMLQEMKAECLRAQKQFKMASQEAAKEAKTQLKVRIF